MTKATTGAQVRERKQTIAERIADIKRELNAGKAPLMIAIEDLSVAGNAMSERSYVVEGATLTCSCGSISSELKAPPNRNVFINDQAQLNVADSKPHLNIRPFGNCRSMDNPTVAEATKANNGQLRPMPCSPMIAMSWTGLGKADVMVEQDQALLSNGMTTCMYNGVIQITDDGQGQESALAEQDQAEAVLLLNMAANEMLMNLKKKWRYAGDASETQAEAIREQVAGTVTREDDETDVERLVGNDKILAAKKLYATDPKAAEELARIGRKMGGTITVEDDLETAQRMVANAYIYRAKRKWQEANQAGDKEKKAQAVQLAQAARKLGGTITDDHSLEEAGNLVADEQGRIPSKYDNNQGRTWNGYYNKQEWENEAQYLYGLAQEPGGSQWVSGKLSYVETMLYGTRAEAEAAYKKYKKASLISQEQKSSSDSTNSPSPNPSKSSENGLDVTPIDQRPYQEGCFAAALAMVVNYYGNNITTKDVVDNFGLYVNSIKLASHYNLDIARTDANTSIVLPIVKNAIDHKIPAIVETHGVRSSNGKEFGHFVVVANYSGDGSNISDYSIIDPWEGTRTSLDQSQHFGDGTVQIVGVRVLTRK
jgi:hypothetical protein